MQTTLLLGLILSCQASLARKAGETGGYALTIIHTNDIHSHYNQSNENGKDCTEEQITNKRCYGGLARIKTKVDELRKEHPNSLLFDAGDQFQGTMFYTYYKGNVTWKAMNLLKYDLMTIGNHEFDNGPENLARVAEHFKFPLVSSNVNAHVHPTLGKIVKKYHLFPEKKLAVVGYITYKAPSICNLGDKIGILDPVIAVQEAIDEVRNLGYNRVIAVSHNGYKEGQELAKKLKGLSLIVGGHSHTYLAPESGSAKDAPESGGLYPAAVKNLDNKQTYIVQAYCNSRFLGHLDIKFGSNGYLTSISGQPIDLNSNVAINKKIQKKVEQRRKPFDEFSKKMLGQATEAFDRLGCYKNECSLGNFLTDIMLNYRPEAEIAILNSGDIRAALPAGPITVEDVLTTLPFKSTVVQITLKGSQIWNLIESVFSRNSTVNQKPVTSFIQVSGLQVSYNPDAPIFKKLISVKIRNKKSGEFVDLKKNRIYEVVTSNFLANGGNNIIAPPVQGFNPLETIDGITMKFIEDHSPISPPNLGRILKSTDLLSRPRRKKPISVILVKSS